MYKNIEKKHCTKKAHIYVLEINDCKDVFCFHHLPGHDKINSLRCLTVVMVKLATSSSVKLYLTSTSKY